jgi:hypothetical protein
LSRNARCLDKDGDPSDKFYSVIKRELGTRRKVSVREIDDLIKKGAL